MQGWTDPDTGEEVNAGRMNLGVITVNLPRVAMESKGDKDKFWKILEQRLDICKQGLVYKVERAKQATPESAPILYKYGAFGKRLNDDQSVDELFKNSRATVSLGYIGLYEVGTVFYGSAWEKNPEAKAFSIDVVKDLYEHCKKWEKEYGYHFSVYGTPSESLTDTFCRLDKKRFGVVKDITDKDYYTNSFHYDVRKAPTPFEKLDFEKDYPKYCSGGFIHYCEYPNLKQNRKPWKPSGTMPTTRSATSARTPQSTSASSAGSRVNSRPPKKGTSARSAGITTRIPVMSSSAFAATLATRTSGRWSTGGRKKSFTARSTWSSATMIWLARLNLFAHKGTPLALRKWGFLLPHRRRTQRVIDHSKKLIKSTRLPKVSRV